MKNIVITGSTRGIGYGLSRQFLKNGCSVMINGTTDQSVEQALAALRDEFPERKIFGLAGNIGYYPDAQRLWENASERLGRIDIWVNNAGIDQVRSYFWEMEPVDYEKLINTNIIGVMNGSRAAFIGMQKQGGGQIFNMEGFGSDGMMREKMTMYGTSKRAVRYFSRSLAKEAKQTKVQVGTLSPGMVATDLLKKSLAEGGKEAEQAKRIFNILADEVETVTSYLTEEILKTDKNGAQIEWLTRPKIAWRFARSMFTKREIFK
ncbi:SDR family oxidoreductase [Bacillus marinisedimentorum]|uniref:SDR family oxidoreductase n=1 Tax=Bacillus marinisedimentorum TaxID=1821260 RepID=UPI000B20AA93|nr:SDR family oxidoreductase [Bacillus marinisedimentorum]